jgi:hypothetical protein
MTTPISSPISLYTGEKATIERVDLPELGPVLRFTGILDEANPGTFLDPLLARIHEEAQAEGLGSLTADLSALAFMNSSGIKAMVKWVMSYRELPAEGRYRLTLRYAPQVTWQQASVKALGLLAKGAVTLQAV